MSRGHAKTTQTLIFAKRAIRTLADASTVDIDCDRGGLWVTLDNDPQDYVLKPGQRPSPRASARTKLYALQPAALRLTPREATPATAARHGPPPRAGSWPVLKARLGVA